MESCSTVSTPCSREEWAKHGAETVIGDQGRITRFRRTAAKLNYMSLDDPRIAYASKLVSQTMSKPTEEGELVIKRAVRYLKGAPACIWDFTWQDKQEYLIGHSDSDWAGCPRSRRSTSGGGIQWGGHLITHWSRT